MLYNFAKVPAKKIKSFNKIHEFQSSLMKQALINWFW